MSPLLAVPALALALAGCSGAADPVPAPGQPTGVPTASETPTGDAGGNDPGESSSPLIQAAERALREVPESTLVSIEEEEKGSLWEVEVALSDGGRHEVVLSRDGNTVVAGPRAKKQSESDKAGYRDRVAAAKIDYRAAIRQILQAVPDGVITELELDRENGMIVWEADVLDASQAKRSVLIDASDGSVIRS
jgi:uncharacterized membrane protein YkoI